MSSHVIDALTKDLSTDFELIITGLKRSIESRFYLLNVSSTRTSFDKRLNGLIIVLNTLNLDRRDREPQDRWFKMRSIIVIL